MVPRMSQVAKFNEQVGRRMGLAIKRRHKFVSVFSHWAALENVLCTDMQR